MSRTQTSPPVPPSALAAAALADPAVHRQCEQDFIQHVQALLADDRLRIDTTRGRRPVPAVPKVVVQADREVELKRLMAEVRRPDRDLQHRMPVGASLDVTLQQRTLWVFKSPIGRLHAVAVSPARSLLGGGEVKPLRPNEVLKILGDIPPAPGNVPTTVVLMSTSGFTTEAHEIAERRPDRTVILVEPNKAGGWGVYGPAETKALADLFDPEAEDSKRSRVHEEVDAAVGELAGAGLASDKLAAVTQLPLPLVEAELRTYAKGHPGLVAKRLDGRVVLFREGSVPPAATSATGGGEMPLIDRMKSLFARKGDHEKKISFLSERRAALMQQRERGYEDLGAFEQREAALREEFKSAAGDLTKRRVTGQLLQLRKDIERRQQLLQVLNQQVNVVSTHLHNLELVQQGKSAKLPDHEEVAADATRAEEMLADLDVLAEQAGSVGSIASGGMSEEEQALYAELEADAAGGGAADPASTEPAGSATTSSSSSAATPGEAARPTTTAAASAARRADPEPG
jgi:hypothetical protein